MDEDSFAGIYAVDDEVEAALQDFSSLSEDYLKNKTDISHLRLNIPSSISQILNPNGLPVVRNLLPRAVDDVRHFVRDHELEILAQITRDFGGYLCCELVPQEEGVFDFDRPDQFVLQVLLLNWHLHFEVLLITIELINKLFQSNVLLEV